MLILLPPSERKSGPPQGEPVSLQGLSHPELGAARRRVGDHLVAASGRRNALGLLGVGPSIAPEVAANTTLWANPTAPATQIYTGVLYDAAKATEWGDEELARAHERVRIISALWGAVSPADHIPAYRLNMCVALPRLGPLTAFWRKTLGATLAPLAQDALVVDCRSADYVTVWKPPAGALTVRVAEVREGKRKIASHTAKFTRGLLTGALVAAERAPRTPDELADVARRLPNVTAVELSDSTLTLITA